MHLDPADTKEPNQCELCNGWVDAHDYYCPYREEIRSASR